MGSLLIFFLGNGQLLSLPLPLHLKPKGEKVFFNPNIFLFYSVNGYVDWWGSGAKKKQQTTFCSCVSFDMLF